MTALWIIAALVLLLWGAMRWCVSSSLYPSDRILASGAVLLALVILITKVF